MDPGGILALDLASTVGWAYGPIVSEGATPTCGAWILPNIGGIGAKCAAFENELLDSISLFQPSHIVMEAALPAKAQSSQWSAEAAIGLSCYAQGTAYRHDIDISKISALTVRKVILGRGTFPKGEAKDFVQAFCREQGWRFPTHDAADALVTWLYASRRISVGHRVA